MAHLRSIQPTVPPAPLRHTELLEPSPGLSREAKTLSHKNPSDQRGSFTSARNVTPAGSTRATSQNDWANVKLGNARWEGRSEHNRPRKHKLASGSYLYFEPGKFIGRKFQSHLQDVVLQERRDLLPQAPFSDYT